MSVKVEIIQGFLESGKTSFINSMLKNDEMSNKNIVIILNEYGEKEVDSYGENQNITVVEESTENMDKSFMLKILSKYKPHVIFIECNGMTENNNIINMFREKELKKSVVIDEVVSILNLKEFNMYFNNMRNLVVDKISSATTVVLNNLDNLNKVEIKKINKTIKNINTSVNLMKHIKVEDEDYYEELEKGLKVFTILAFSIFIIIGMVLSSLIVFNRDNYNIFIEHLKRFYVIFVSLLIEGLPFILLGSFLSGIISLTIPDDLFVKILPKNKICSCIISSIGGLFLPICDCGTIPIMKSLIKKNVSIGSAVAFMLSAPIVNPICIMSTYYAFQGKISVILSRISLGIITAVITGIIIDCSIKNVEDIYDDTSYNEYCSCNICSGNTDIKDGYKSKFSNVISHSINEFFNVTKYMIVGMLICSAFQCIIGDKVINPGDNRSGLIIMMLLGFLLSVCSTSDAFIGKGFLNQFSINSVMGFLVVGPMIDVKNIIVLSHILKKRFIVKLIAIIFIVSFAIMINLNIG